VEQIRQDFELDVLNGVQGEVLADGDRGRQRTHDEQLAKVGDQTKLDVDQVALLVLSLPRLRLGHRFTSKFPHPCRRQPACSRLGCPA
jgi:hypothetical protein